MREYLKSLFDRHQTLDCQRRGNTLLGVDLVRLQYSPVRLAEVLVMNAIASTQGDSAVSNQKAGPNDKNAKEDCDASEATMVPHEENSDQEVACKEISARKEEDVNASLSTHLFHDKKEDDCTCTT